MTLHYAGKHRAPKTAGATRRTGAKVTAAAALGIGAPLMVSTTFASPASAQAPSPSGSGSVSPAPSGGAQSSAASTSAASTSAASDSTSSATVELGDTGQAVTDVQEKVGVAADGVFGPETDAAVKEVQNEEGLAADGVVGPETRAVLGSSSDDSGSGSTSDAPSDGGAATVSADAGRDGGAASVATVSTGSASSGSSSSSSSNGILGTAESLVGTPYVYGGDSPAGFDCSGYIQYVFAQNGVDVPRMTDQQQAAATPVSEPQPGDLVFFGSPAYHVGIYAGDGQMYDAGNSESPVQKRDIWTDDVSYGRL